MYLLIVFQQVPWNSVFCFWNLYTCQKQLCDKAVKALYSLKRNILSLNPSIFTSLHIFDHTIKPILMYGSEIWACSLSKKATNDDLFDFSRIYQSFYSEKLHIHFGKYILGVHKRSSNFAGFFFFQNLGDSILFYSIP